MYSALCPNCGAALYGSAHGRLLVQCVACQWSGHATFHFLPNGSQSKQSSGGINGGINIGGLLANVANVSYPILAPLGPDEAEADPLTARREALCARLGRLSADVADLLRTLDTEEWQMPAAASWRRYERLQAAHAALYLALGGARMGDYHPARAQLDTALAEVLLWALLTLDAVEG